MAALLQDIGILAMMAESPREYADNVLSVARLPNTVAAERAHFGFSHVDVSSAIVKTWNVGDEFAQAIKHHHDRISEPTTSRPSLTQVLQAAHLGAMALHGGHAAPTLLDDHLKNWLMFIEQNLSITADSADDIVSDMHARVDNYAAMFNLKIGGGRSAVAVISEAKDLLNEIAIETQLKLVESQKTSKWRRVANELYSDWLSGAYNRRYVSECLEDAMAPWVTKRKPIAMLFLDVDKFKDINDTYGHRVGDQAIKHVAKWLSSTTRRKDIVIRLGGDEFLVVMQIALRPCKVVVNRIAQELPPLPMADEEPMPMSLSAGCVFLNPDPNEPPDINWLIDEADRLMYEVKNRGGRNVALREIAAQI
jgi:diguanylate cyclase (GGDEF)-like protein